MGGKKSLFERNYFRNLEHKQGVRKHICIQLRCSNGWSPVWESQVYGCDLCCHQLCHQLCDCGQFASTFCIHFLGLWYKGHKLFAFKQKECVVSQCWRPEVRNQGVSMALLPLKAVGEKPSLACGLVPVACLWSLALPGLRQQPFHRLLWCYLVFSARLSQYFFS